MFGFCSFFPLKEVKMEKEYICFDIAWYTILKLKGKNGSFNCRIIPTYILETKQ